MANIREDAPIDWEIAGFWVFQMMAGICFWVSVGMSLSGQGADIVLSWLIGSLAFAGLAVDNVQRNI